MEKIQCSSCQSPKAALNCALCNTALCKSCAQFISGDSFAFDNKPAVDLSHGCFCNACYDEKVAPELERYNQTLEQAKEVLVFSKSQSKETRLIKRTEAPVKVVECTDENETVLRLAFQAAKVGCNAIIDMQLSSKKVRNAGYQSTIWSGTAMPARVDASKMVNGHPIISNPN